ncbi:flavin reductase family protein [Nocardioides hungaricus]
MTKAPHPPDRQPERAPLDPRLFRQAMGRFATGITIITTVTDDGQVHGMTANGFMSVSLSPPLVLISLGKCRMATLLRQTGRYGVSMLAAQQRDYSRHFAGQAQLTVQPRFDWHDDVAFLGGAVAHVGADVTDIHEAGDHTLFIGEVTHLAMSEGRPLIFHGGDYESLIGKDDQEVFFV